MTTAGARRGRSRSAVGRAGGAVHSLTRSSPARSALLIFALVIAVFTSLLMMPWSTASGDSPAFHEALFVATSAVAVTGLTPVDTAAHWSSAGHVVILLGIQIGGLGILTIASLLAISVTRHLGIRTRLLAQESMSTGRLGEVGTLIRTVVLFTLAIQGLLALVLVPRFAVVEGSFLTGLWHGIFYSVSAFNNAGFVLHDQGLAAFDHDPLVLGTLMVGVFLGSLGFPVLLVLYTQRWRFRRWSIHARLTVEVSVVLLVLGAAAFAVLEWNQRQTLGPMSWFEKVQSSLFASVMMRSGGFSVIDPVDQRSETMLVSDALMFAGGGSISTAGGLKVTTIAVLFLAILAEARGHEEVMVHGRTVAASTVRVAVAVAVLGMTLIFVSALALMVISGEQLERPLFESISAFATCGLSSGLTEELPPSGLYVLTGLMFAGRVGIITFAAAVAMRTERVRYRLPEGRPLIG